MAQVHAHGGDGRFVPIEAVQVAALAAAKVEHALARLEFERFEADCQHVWAVSRSARASA